MTTPTIASGTGVRTMTAPADTVASLPVVERINEMRDFRKRIYEVAGDAVDVMLASNAEIITELVEALHALKAEFEKFSRYGSPIAHAANEAMQKADAVLAKAREGAAQ